MINIIFKNIFRFLILVAIQVLILNNIQYSGFVVPFLYVLFILMLPFQTPVWAVLILSFLLGATVDILSDTIGLNIAASVLMGFLRYYVLKVLSPREGYEPGAQPSLKFFGISWFLRYSVPLVLAHHFFLFYLETFSFSEFFSTFFRVIVSTIFTIGLILLSQYIVNKGKV